MDGVICISEVIDISPSNLPRGATPGPRSGGAAERRYPESEVRGSDERSYVVSKFRGRGREEIPHAPKPEARGGGREDQPHV